MLILTYADRFRIDFHQLRQRILQTTGDRYRATQRNVEIRELLRCQLGSRVNRRASFADDHFLRGHFRELLLHVEIETFGFAGSCTVADRHQFNVMLFTQRSNSHRCFCGLSGVRVNGIGRYQFASGIDHRHFYPSTQTRIEAHRCTQSGRGRHQQIVQVTGKDVDCFIFRAFAHGTHQFGFQMHQHLDAPGPAHYAFAPAIRRGIVQAQAKVIHDDLLAIALFGRLIELRIGIQRKLEYAFVTPTEHRQRAVRRHRGQRFVMIEIVAEFRPFLFFTAHHRRNQMRVLPQIITHFRQQRGIFGKPFHQDIARAIQRGFGICHAFIGINILCSGDFWRV